MAGFGISGVVPSVFNKIALVELSIWIEQDPS
jgi:hypothetical protein